MAGSEIDELLTTMDVFPTFAKLIGAKVPDDRMIDGKNILPMLLDGAESPREYFFYSHWGVFEAVRLEVSYTQWRRGTLQSKDRYCRANRFKGTIS